MKFIFTNIHLAICFIQNIIISKICDINIGFSDFRFSWEKFDKNSKLYLMILILGKTYICNENTEKNTGIFRCFF